MDEQRRGPYKMWHHEHHFKEVEEGVEMTDIISYSMPLGFIGKFVHWLFIKKQLESIFDYRIKKVDELFHPVQKDPEVNEVTSVNGAETQKN